MESPSRASGKNNQFDAFFVDPVYLRFKKLFWNFQIRRKIIRDAIQQCPARSILEVGAGIAPMVPEMREVTYTDISHAAIDHLKEQFPDRPSLVAEAGCLPFQNESFNLAVSSEVLEHIPDDRKALEDIFRILKPDGVLIITVPVHAYFFAWDDKFVGHERRYCPKDLSAQLTRIGFTDIRIRKVAGILDKAALMAAVLVFKLLSQSFILDKNKKSIQEPQRILKAFLPIYGFVNVVFGFFVQLEAKIIPLSLTTIVMVRARKNKSEEMCRA